MLAFIDNINHWQDDMVWKLLNNVDPKRDLLVSEGPLDALDHSAPYPNFGGKMGMDATRKTREEGMGREWPDEINILTANIHVPSRGRRRT